MNHIVLQLRETGIALSHGSAAEYVQLAEKIGTIVGREAIRLREGAHAYVARPGPVPLHTDQPEVDVIAWRCEAQDPEDGANWLLDTQPIVQEFDPQIRLGLEKVMLECPPLSGGPPTLHFPVLRPNGYLFCSPWLRSVDGPPESQAFLDLLRLKIKDRARQNLVRIRLEPGQILWIDNHRIMHGRGPINKDSQRLLQRLWIQYDSTQKREPTPKGQTLSVYPSDR